jgi:hypothetical protein
LTLLVLMAGGAAAEGIQAGSAGATASGHVAATHLTTAVDATTASSAAVSLSAVSVASGVSTTLATGSGTFDLSQRIGQGTVTVPVLASVPGVGSNDAVGVVVDNSTLYLNIPVLAPLAAGKQWFSAPLPSSAAKVASGPLSATLLGDPTKLLHLLTTLGGTVTTVGPATVDGVATTEYQTSLHLSQVASAARAKVNAHAGRPVPGAKGRSIPRSVKQGFGALGLTTIPVEVWVGSDGLVRQATFTLNLAHVNLANPGALLHGLAASPSASPTGPGSVVTVTLGLSEFGTPVSVTAPPAAQVAPLRQTLSTLKGDLSATRPAVG